MRYRLIILLALLSIAALGFFSGFYQYLTPDRLREVASEAGIWGPLLLVVLFAVLEPFFVPGAIFLLASATLWPFWLALAVNLGGATGAGMIGFAFARYFGREWVEAHMPTRLKAWDDYLTSKGLRAVMLFRLFFFLNPASHWALGLSGVRASTAALGTALGFAPAVWLWTYFGAEILNWFADQSIETWLAVGAAVLAVIAFRRFRSRRAASDTA
jgi:uncharacterized membrane protein YdjX (TVP38/TMEM64 family)